ncbi:unnamed protein product [Heligmosomoides polygyrus]|uniref:AAA_12 domain-containing protein n=1 Tax=Heligmosomoides polygyrus TaxID=6339 RepID=A0A183GG29_HELPZ|nr:unnamed protein product [Heligmosomoides polygyrus]
MLTNFSEIAADNQLQEMWIAADHERLIDHIAHIDTPRYTTGTAISQDQRKEYRLAEKEASRITTKGIAIMLKIPEPAMLAIATRVSNARHVYIGDVQQLEPHIRYSRTSTPAKFGALGVMGLLVQRRIPMTPLTTTFRSHSELNAMRNRLFYDKSLISGTTAANRRLFLDNTRCRNRKLPFLFVKRFGGPGMPRHHPPTARYRDPARIDSGNHLLQGAVPAHGELRPEQGIHLYTVDSVQGREKDIVILLTTRSHFKADRAEFLDNPRRMNVVITRSKHGVIILGHERSLTCLPNWGHLIRWARARYAIVKSSELVDCFQ